MTLHNFIRLNGRVTLHRRSLSDDLTRGGPLMGTQDLSAAGQLIGARDLWDATRAAGDNFLVVKVSYWLGVN